VIPRSIPPFERYGHFVPAEDATLTEHLFADGDWLSDLAHRYYGEWRQWRVIADRNAVIDPRAIDPGTVLLIPERPLEVGAFGSL
jgi:nucleoid-associated protein YgaU